MPQNEWILDVLADLKTFASTNGMRVLAEQLDDTKLIAAAEIASQKEEARSLGHGESSQFGKHTGGLGRHQRA